jgi:hypothetical protein
VVDNGSAGDELPHPHPMTTIMTIHRTLSSSLRSAADAASRDARRRQHVERWHLAGRSARVQFKQGS